MIFKGSLLRTSYEEGSAVATFSLEDTTTEELEGLKNEVLSIEANEYRLRRSLSANGYLWSLCGDIAKALGVGKDTMYEMLIKEYGVCEAYQIVKSGVESYKRLFKFTEIEDEWETVDAYSGKVTKLVELKCYRGSHDYDTKEFSVLLDGAIKEANDIGLYTYDKERIDELLRRWEQDHKQRV